MENYRQLSDLAQAKIEALRSDGYVLSDSDVILINALAWEVQSPSKRMALAKGKPIKCGNTWLWPFTIHNKAWFFDCGREFSNPRHALAYALAHRNDELYTITEEHVDKWAKTLTCTDDELEMACAIIIDGDRQDEIPIKDSEAITIHEMARMMMVSHGGTAEMWEKEVSIKFIYDFIDTLSKQHEEAGKSMQKDRAQMALAYLTHRIRRRKRNG